MIRVYRLRFLARSRFFLPVLTALVTVLVLALADSHHPASIGNLFLAVGALTVIRWGQGLPRRPIARGGFSRVDRIARDANRTPP